MQKKLLCFILLPRFGMRIAGCWCLGRCRLRQAAPPVFSTCIRRTVSGRCCLPCLGKACSLQTTARTETGQSGSAGHFYCTIILLCGMCLRAATLTGRPMQASGMRCRMILRLCFPALLSVRCSVRERQRLPFGRNIVRRTTAYSAAAFQAQARRMPAGRWKHCKVNMQP